MKIKTNIVTLLAVLAILGSLVAIVAVPAGAVTLGFAVTMSPVTAYANAQTGYTIGPFTTANAISAGGTITITFPAGTVMPGGIAKGYVTWTGADGTAPLWVTLDPDPSVSGTSVIIQIPSSATAAQRAAGSHKVVISQTAGIKNPALSKSTLDVEPYKITVTTSAGGEMLAPSAAYAIEDYVSFTPLSGAFGLPVTVTGGGFSPGSSVTIGGGAMGAGDVGSDGKFSATCAAVSALAITAADGTGRTATSPTNFNLLPTLIVGPPISGNVGTTVYLTGRHFTPGGNIAALASATFGGLALPALSTSGTGTSQIGVLFTDLDADGFADDFNAYFLVPAFQNAGLTTIAITDSGAKVGTAQFTVNPRILELGPVTGAPGITVTVSGSGFAASATGGTITLQQGIGVLPGISIATDGNGAFTQVITIPSTAIAGALPITVAIAGCNKTVTFAVTGNVLNLSSSSGPKGSYVTIWGSGMTPSGTITSLKIGTVTLLYTGAITIDSAGNIQAVTAVIPAGAGWGSQIISAIDNGTPFKTATATYTVAQPSIEISPPDGYMGDMVTIKGTGWLPGARGMVIIRVPSALAPTIATPGDDGSFTAAVSIPVTGVVGPRAVTITAEDSILQTAPSKTFMVKSASISVDPPVQVALKTVTVTGLGFTPQSPVSGVTIIGADVPTTPELVVTDAVGKFTCTFVVPGLVGVKTIGATVLTDTRTTFLTITPAPVTVGVQTANISSKLVIIWGYSGGTWQMYDPADPAGSALITLTSTNGYWIQVSADCTLVYGGFSKALSSAAPGWTLVGWP